MEEVPMATFVVLAGFSDQGIRNVKETVSRAEAFKEMAKKSWASSAAGAGMTQRRWRRRAEGSKMTDIKDITDRESYIIAQRFMSSFGLSN
jgi:hypothetical protein